MKRTWYSICTISIVAVIVIVAIDHFAARIAPPVNRREAEDGIRDLANSNPDVLVLGSSHARTLHVLGQELTARTKGARSLIAVPLENGKLVVYDWALQHRLAPLMEEKDATGKLVRNRIKQFVLLTEWWDSCAPDERNRFQHWNLPSRAWTAGDFTTDVLESGLNGYNRNYLQNRLRRTFLNSALLYDRINRRLVENAMDRVRGRPIGPTRESTQLKVIGWQRMVEAGTSCLGNPQEMAALRNIIEYVRGHGLEMTIILFPRKPDTITEKASVTTIARFAGLVREMAVPRGVRVMDLTTSSPLTSNDFMEDFDHVNPEGNAKFSKWALDTQLHFLLENESYERVSSASLAGVGR